MGSLVFSAYAGGIDRELEEQHQTDPAWIWQATQHPRPHRLTPASYGGRRLCLGLLGWPPDMSLSLSLVAQPGPDDALWSNRPCCSPNRRPPLCSITS